jgi:NAD(P)-dependent dehydrogenase (short-subunit alcohol dehydrogenase family)
VTDALARKIAEKEERLDILINNAGIGQAPYGLTKDGLENHYAVRPLPFPPAAPRSRSGTLRRSTTSRTSCSRCASSP